MKYHTLIVLLFIFSMLSSKNVEASGQTLLKACSHAEDYFKDDGTFNHDNMTSASLCIGVLRGLKDGIELGHVVYSESEDQQKGICFPKEMELEQMNLVLLKYLRGNPEVLHEDIWLVLFKAMTPFHCKENKAIK